MSRDMGGLGWIEAEQGRLRKLSHHEAFGSMEEWKSG